MHNDAQWNFWQNHELRKYKWDEQFTITEMGS